MAKTSTQYIMDEFTPEKVEQDANNKFNILNDYRVSSWSLEKTKNLMKANLEVTKMEKENIHSNNENIISKLDDKLHTKKRALIYDEGKYRTNTTILNVLKVILLITSIIVLTLIYKRYNK